MSDAREAPPGVTQTMEEATDVQETIAEAVERKHREQRRERISQWIKARPSLEQKDMHHNNLFAEEEFLRQLVDFAETFVSLADSTDHLDNNTHHHAIETYDFMTSNWADEAQDEADVKESAEQYITNQLKQMNLEAGYDLASGFAFGMDCDKLKALISMMVSEKSKAAASKKAFSDMPDPDEKTASGMNVSAANVSKMAPERSAFFQWFVNKGDITEMSSSKPEPVQSRAPPLVSTCSEPSTATSPRNPHVDDMADITGCSFDEVDDVAIIITFTDDSDSDSGSESENDESFDSTETSVSSLTGSSPSMSPISDCYSETPKPTKLVLTQVEVELLKKKVEYIDQMTRVIHAKKAAHKQRDRERSSKTRAQMEARIDVGAVNMTMLEKAKNGRHAVRRPSPLRQVIDVDFWDRLEQAAKEWYQADYEELEILEDCIDDELLEAYEGVDADTEAEFERDRRAYSDYEDLDVTLVKSHVTESGSW